MKIERSREIAVNGIAAVIGVEGSRGLFETKAEAALDNTPNEEGKEEVRARGGSCTYERVYNIIYGKGTQATKGREDRVRTKLWKRSEACIARIDGGTAECGGVCDPSFPRLPSS